MVSWFINFIFLLAAVGCSAADVLLPNKEKNSSPSPKHSDPVPAATSNHSPKSVNNQRLLRRITIDLLGRLPTIDEILRLNSGRLTLDDLVEEFLVDPQFSNAMGARHLRQWRLENGELPELQRIAKENATLKSALTPEVIAEIQAEPGNILRKVLDDNLPFSTIFNVPWTVIGNNALDIFGKVPGSSPWLGEAKTLFQYDDNRPRFGVIQTWGLNGSVDNARSDTGFPHAKAIFQKFACVQDTEDYSHLFYDETGETIEDGLAESALDNPNCAGCHRKIQDPAADLAGYSLGNSLQSWLAYSNVGPTGGSSYVGKTYSNVEELADLFASDPRVANCEIINLVESILQRPISTSAADLQMLALLNSKFLTSNQSLRAITKYIIHSETYSVEIQDSETPSRELSQHSGVKYLPTWAWKGIMGQLNPRAGNLTVPRELAAGMNDLASPNRQIPSNLYFNALRKFAKNAAASIIDDELADGRTRNSRMLLRIIPDGSGSTSDSDLINAQIISLWEFVTGNSLTVDDGQIQLLRELFDIASKSQAVAAAKARAGWTYVLRGILMSPEFITY
jgi:hypothetical protein